MKITNIIIVILFSFFTLLITPTFAESTSNNLITAIQDTAITGYIKAKMAMDKTVADADTDITTNNGKVTLSGTVNSDIEAANLIQLVQSTSGVKEVDTTALKIKKNKQPLADIAITAKIKGLFIREKLLNAKDVSIMSIHVNTKNGIVYLTGTADNQKQMNNASALAKSVSGVTKVISTVTVVKSSY